MTMMNEVNPPLDDVLEHHGVKGMRWGVRRDAQTGARPIAVSLNNSKFGKASERNAEAHNRRVAARPTRAQIKTARTNNQVRQMKIHDQKRLVKNTEFGSQRVKETQKLNQMKTAALKHPDAVTARRLTRGEKAALGVLAVFTPVGVLPVAVGVGVNLHERHKSERLQGTRK